MPSATIQVIPRGTSESYTLDVVYQYVLANSWTCPGKPGGEWTSSSTSGLQFFNGAEATDKPVWLKLYDVQWDISTALRKGRTGWGVLCATSKVVDWEVLSC
jgi:hypothetical protein